MVEAESPQYALPGQTGKLRCSVQINRPSTLLWFKIENGAEKFLATDYSSNTDFGVFQISNIQPSDAGQYRCRGHYNDRNDFNEADFEFIVYSKFTAAVIIDASISVLVLCV